MAVLNITLRITSSINKVNGSTEPGPSTSLNTTVRSKDAFDAVEKLVKDTINNLHQRSFSSSFRHGLLKNFSDIYVDPPWGESKLDITYYIDLYASGHDDEGKYVEDSFRDDFTRPL